MAQSESHQTDESADKRAEDRDDGVQYNVDRTSGVVEMEIIVDEETFEEIPDTWDAEEFVEGRAKQYIEQDIKAIYSLASVKTMVKERTGIDKHHIRDDVREFEVWAKW